MKKEIPGLQTTQCFLHRHALAAKTLPPKLNEVLGGFVRVMNHFRWRALDNRLFKALCEKVGAEHSVLLSHASVRWLSLRTALGRLLELRDEVRAFLEEKNMLAGTLDAPLSI